MTVDIFPHAGPILATRRLRACSTRERSIERSKKKRGKNLAYLVQLSACKLIQLINVDRKTIYDWSWYSFHTRFHDLSAILSIVVWVCVRGGLKGRWHTSTIRDEALPCSYTRRAEFTNGIWDMRSTKAGESEEGRVVREAARPKVRKEIEKKKKKKVKHCWRCFSYRPEPWQQRYEHFHPDRRDQQRPSDESVLVCACDKNSFYFISSN